MRPDWHKNYLYLDVVGAGKIEISKSNEVRCGGKTGFSFGVEWGQHGYTGGLLSKEEAIRLAEYILQKCKPKSLRRIKLERINSVL